MSKELKEKDEDSSEATKRELHETSLYQDVKPTQWPIIYSPEYNIGFLGLEKLHPFDAGKWGKVYGFLKGSVFAYVPTSYILQLLFFDINIIHVAYSYHSHNATYFQMLSYIYLHYNFKFFYV